MGKTSCSYDKNSEKASCYYRKSSVLREKHHIIMIKHLLLWEKHIVIIRKHLRCDLNEVRVGGVNFLKEKGLHINSLESNIGPR